MLILLVDTIGNRSNMIVCLDCSKKFTRRYMERHRNAMQSSGDDDERADTEGYTEESLSDTDQVRKSRDYVYGICQYKSTLYKNAISEYKSFQWKILNSGIV